MNVPIVLVAALVAMTVINAVALIALAADLGRIRLRLDPDQSDLPLVPNEGVSIGAPNPNATLVAFPGDGSVPLGAQPSLVTFVSSSCEPCKRLWPDLRRIADEGNYQVVAVVGDDPAHFLPDAGKAKVVFDRDGDIAARWRVRRTPFAYFVADGRIRAKGVVNKYAQIVTLLDGRGRSGPPEWSEGPASTETPSEGAAA